MDTMQTISPSMDYHSNVDCSSPFSSVKEAVAVFGERFLTPEVYSPKPFFFTKQEISHPSPTYYSHTSKQTLWNDKDTTLVETIKKLESELEETKEEVKLLKQRETENEVALASLNAELHKNMSKTAQAEAFAEPEASRDLSVKMERSPTLAQILNLTQEEKEVLFGRTKKSEQKKKPIIPLVGDLFWRKKRSSSASHVHWN